MPGDDSNGPNPPAGYSQQPLLPTQPNLARVMKAAAYKVVWKGKWQARRGDRTQEVVGSIPISSTNLSQNLRPCRASQIKCEVSKVRLVCVNRLTIYQSLTTPEGGLRT